MVGIMTIKLVQRTLLIYQIFDYNKIATIINLLYYILTCKLGYFSNTDTSSDLGVTTAIITKEHLFMEPMHASVQLYTLIQELH